MNTFRSLRSRNFRLFFYGQSISLMGTWMQKTAVCWLVYRVTESAFLLGLVGFASLIPSLFLSPYTGIVIDRYNRFKLMMITQIAAMVQAGALALVVFLGYYNITLIVLLSLLQGVINAFDVNCRQTLMLDMVDEPQDLPNAIALNSTMANMARIIGPALAGIVLSAFGEDFCFISNFLSFVPVLICLMLMNVKIPEPARTQRKIMDDLKQGFTYIRSEKEMRTMILLIAVSSVFVIPFNTLMPIYARDIFNGNAQTFSIIESAIGVGALVSAVYMANLRNTSNLLNIVLISSILLGGSVLVMAFSKYFSGLLLFLVVSGLGMMAQTSAINTYIQTHADPTMRGRAIGYFLMAYQGMIPVGSLLVGFFAEAMGTREAVALCGSVGLLSAFAFWYYGSKHFGMGKVLNFFSFQRL